MSEYYSTEDLRHRGWKPSTISMLLAEPDALMRNPADPTGAPMKLYLRARVEDIEAGASRALVALQPPEIQAALKKHNINPLRNECYRNCQKLYLAADELRDRLCYREGVAWSKRFGRTFNHAWLTLDGKIVDLAMAVDEVDYIDSYVVSYEDVRRYCRENGKTDGASTDG